MNTFLFVNHGGSVDVVNSEDILEFQTSVIKRAITDKRIEMFKAIKGLIQNNPDIKVYILGVKMYAIYMTMLLQKYCSICEFTYVLEDIAECKNKKINTGEIISLDEYLENRIENSMFFTDSDRFIQEYKDVIPSIYCIEYGYVNDKPVIWTKDIFEKNIELFYETYSLFSDNLSKTVMKEWIIASLTGEVRHLRELKTDNQYFNELTSNINGGTYVDCGAYDGDTVSQYVGFAKNYDSIVAFEPDEENYDKLVHRIKKEKIIKASAIKSGVYFRYGKVFFNNSKDETARCIVENTGESIEVCAIDSLHDDNIKFIKMDIEGSEMDALRGARNTIRRLKPTLAVCVYHKVDDLITIPQYIIDLVGKECYDFYLRYHGRSLTELVLYGVPRGFA